MLKAVACLRRSSDVTYGTFQHYVMALMIGTRDVTVLQLQLKGRCPNA